MGRRGTLRQVRGDPAVERSPQIRRNGNRRGAERGRGLGPRMRHQLFVHMGEGTHPGSGLSTPICLPPGSLTLGGPQPWLHMSLGLGLELCACLRFPFTNSCSFLSFLLSSSWLQNLPFYTRPHSLVQSLCSPTESGQLEMWGQGLRLA